MSTRTFDAAYYDDLVQHLAENVDERTANMPYERALRRSVERFLPELTPRVADRILQLSETEPLEEHRDAVFAHRGDDRIVAAAVSVLSMDVHKRYWRIQSETPVKATAEA